MGWGEVAKIRTRPKANLGQSLQLHTCPEPEKTTAKSAIIRVKQAIV